jgi:hypothetical protein
LYFKFIHNYRCKRLSYFMESYMESDIEMFYFTIQLNQWHNIEGGERVKISGICQFSFNFNL